MDPKQTKPRLLRTADAAAYLGLSPSLLEKLRLRLEGPTYVKLGQAVCYDVRDLDEWVERNKVPTFDDRPKDDSEAHRP
jgi:predicted DNA-binding transcriptional regulator AlpA